MLKQPLVAVNGHSTLPSARIGICNDVVSTVHATFEQTGEKVLRPGSCPGFRVEAFADSLAAFVLGGLPHFNAAPEGGINNLEFG